MFSLIVAMELLSVQNQRKMVFSMALFSGVKILEKALLGNGAS